MGLTKSIKLAMRYPKLVKNHQKLEQFINEHTNRTCPYCGVDFGLAYDTEVITVIEHLNEHEQVEKGEIEEMYKIFGKVQEHTAALSKAAK